jgi:hypothetical protein
MAKYGFKMMVEEAQTKRKQRMDAALQKFIGDFRHNFASEIYLTKYAPNWQLKCPLSMPHALDDVTRSGEEDNLNKLVQGLLEEFSPLDDKWPRVSVVSVYNASREVQVLFDSQSANMLLSPPKIDEEEGGKEESKMEVGEEEEEPKKRPSKDLRLSYNDLVQREKEFNETEFTKVLEDFKMEFTRNLATNIFDVTLDTDITTGAMRLYVPMFNRFLLLKMMRVDKVEYPIIDTIAEVLAKHSTETDKWPKVLDVVFYPNEFRIVITLKPSVSTLKSLGVDVHEDQ